jgi:hypothetical protein
MLRLLIPVIAIALFVWLVRQTIASFRPTDAHDADPLICRSGWTRRA